VVCGTIASGDDYEDIVDWGKALLSFLHGFAEFHFGIPCADWLRCVMNRIDPDLFMACFTSWVEECWPELVAIDGESSRRSIIARPARRPCTWGRPSRPTAGWCSVRTRSLKNPTRSPIPALVERLDLKGALVSFDAMGCNPTIAQSILDAEADYLLAVKDNLPTLHADIESYFETTPPDEVEKVETLGKDHGRFEVRNHSISHVVDWYAAERSYPGAPRILKLTTIATVESRIERGDKIETEQRSYISSRALSAAAFAQAARGHRGIENKLHWVLDVTFGEDLSRLRTGHGAKNTQGAAIRPPGPHLGHVRRKDASTGRASASASCTPSRSRLRRDRVQRSLAAGAEPSIRSRHL
jgi:predicted transposase YbfD/YdcC